MFFRKTVQNLSSYEFSYVIDTNEILSQHTEEKFNDVVKGYYSFLQPDGQIRVVHYLTEGNKGFKAYIKYRSITNGFKGHLRFPIDFQRPLRLLEPVSTIPLSFLEPSKYQKKHHR